MRDQVGSQTTRIRILGGAIGSTVSAIAALLGLPTGIVAIIGLVGIPVGALVGAWFAPSILEAERAGKRILIAAFVATVLGVALYALVTALAAGRGASITDLLRYMVVPGLFFGIYGAIIGGPVALGVAVVATWFLRRLAPRVDRLWRRSAVILGVVAVALALTLAASVTNQTNEARRFGDRIGFEYRVDNYSAAEYMLDVRTYWDAEMAGGESGSVGPGSCTISGKGNDTLQASDWAIWLDPANADWVDRPPGTPVITSAEYQGKGDVKLTIVIEADGTSRVIEGQPDRCD